jgi:electron transfer flavoprotein alpha subunit
MANGILILAEHLRGELSDITFEMLGVGRKLADALGVPLHAALVGRDVAGLAPKLGLADQVFVVDDAQLDVPPPATVAALLAGLLEAKQESLVLVSGTNLATGIGSLLSERAGLPFVNFSRELRAEGGDVLVVSQLFGGKILSDVRLAGARGIVCAYPGAFPADAGRSDKTPPVEKVALVVEAPAVTFKRFIEPEAGDVDITKQEVLVAVGRGIQTQDNIELAEELAGVLRGAVCGSRPVIDQGWLPLSRQVGKSGLTVKPRFYIALGISGAPEHWEGMAASQTIVAVNTDPAAPIFDFAHYGVCGDVLELVPALIEKIKAHKG